MSNNSPIIIHLAGHAHLDMAWIWRWQDACQEVLSTFRSAVERIRENPKLYFVQGEAVYYEWAEEFDPELFQDIRKLVSAGNWQIVNGWWNQPDCNLPCGEALIRQALYGKKYFRKKFNIEVDIAFSPDSFGHPASLCQILSRCGFKYFIFKRPQRQELQLPGQLFKWENNLDDRGTSGSNLISFRLTDEYSIEECESIEEHIIISKEGTIPGFNETLCLFGVGNHGGGPTIKQIAKIKELISEDNIGNIVFGSPEKYFQSVVRQQPEISVWKNGLQFNAVGTYSVMADLKQLNRKAEDCLISAEKWNTLCRTLLGRGAAGKELEILWKKLLFTHFHDIITGSCIPAVEKDATHTCGAVIDGAAQIEHHALRNLVIHYSKAESREDYNGTVIFVFNPTSFPRREMVEIEPWFGWYENTSADFIITDSNEKLVPWQEIQADSAKPEMRRIIFPAIVPPFGFSAYKISLANGMENNNFPNESRIDETVMENDFWKIEFDSQSGCIAKISGKINQRQVLPGNIAKAVVIDDKSNTWGHDVTNFGQASGQFKNAEFKILEKGPLRVKLRIKTHYGDSWLIQDFSLCTGDRLIRCEAKVNWHERRKVMKINFPMKQNPEIIQGETPYGWSESPKNHEFPAQKWVMAGNKSENIILLNNGKYGFDVFNKELRMTVLRSPIYALEKNIKNADAREFDYTDQGIHEFAYGFVPGSELPETEQAFELGTNFNSPLRLLTGSLYRHKLPEPESFIEVFPREVILEAFKMTEDDSGNAEIRLFNTSSGSRDVEITVRGLLKHSGFTMNPGEILTLLISENKIKEITKREALNRTPAH